MKLKITFAAFIAVFLCLCNIVQAGFIIQGEVPVFINTDRPIKTELPVCVKDQIGTKTGELKRVQIDLALAGRYTVGDVNNDGQPDFVVSDRNNVSAYDICGDRLWTHKASTNWDFSNHVYWGWSSYGWVGDADGDNKAEFLHIGADWKTLYVRDGKTGNVERTINLGGETKWMYVLLGKRIDDTGNKTTRVFVTGEPGRHHIKSFDIRGTTKQDWYFRAANFNAAYMPPQIANINQLGGDEIVHGSIAVDSNGKQIWNHNAGGLSQLGAFHTLQVKDIDPDKKGLEATLSVYGPVGNSPAIVNIASSRPSVFNWTAGRDHGHQHVVGDFAPSIRGLETLVRYHDGINHYLIDRNGRILSNYKRPDQKYYPHHWNEGELIMGVEWDDKPGTEVLSVERHTRFKEIPAMVITTGETQKTSQGNIVLARSRFFHGGFDVPKEDTDNTLPSGPSSHSWFPHVKRSSEHDNDGPYEGNAQAVDLFGDGREEIIAYADRKIVIYFNSGITDTPKRWGNHSYMSRKKLWCNAYNPR